MQLLSRISKMAHADLAARIMLVQARVNPPSEASGLNKGGLINRSHPTVVEDVPEVLAAVCVCVCVCVCVEAWRAGKLTHP